MNFGGDAWKRHEQVSRTLRSRDDNGRTSEFRAQASAGARSACKKRSGADHGLTAAATATAPSRTNVYSADSGFSRDDCESAKRAAS
jgi:hypothetical protein